MSGPLARANPVVCARQHDARTRRPLLASPSFVPSGTFVQPVSAPVVQARTTQGQTPVAPKKSAAAAKPDPARATAPRRNTRATREQAQPDGAAEAALLHPIALGAGPPAAQQTNLTPKSVRLGNSKTGPMRRPELADLTIFADATEAPHKADPGPASAAAPRVVAPDTKPGTPQGLCAFQTYHEAWQRDLLDPHFTAFDESRQPSELPELTLPQGLLHHAATAQVRHWGVVSWRFTQQTGLTGQDLRAAIEHRPTADAYLVNPAVADEGLYHNAWLQSETEHPGVLTLARALLHACGLPVDDLTSVHSQVQHGSATVLVANRAFWSAYVKFIQNFVSHSKNLDAPQRTQLMARFQDDSALMGSSNLLGAIIRRLLPVFLKTDGRGLTLRKLSLPVKERELNIHEQMRREMKHVAHNTESA